jgi:wyosine [tRNA(Phe)-imidazoG37] synthetase (radical SAM superfamily)
MISFGPIPSRRLGKSLGISNIPSQKICSYSCIYCQVGLTKKYSTTRAAFYEPAVIYTEVQNHLKKLKDGDKPDYLTFVANGEPTLDSNLGKAIKLLKTLNIPIAVITNASLLSSQEVRKDLSLADWVSIKIDANNEVVWKEINRPHALLDFSEYVDSLLQFSSEYKGKLVTETMLVEGVNDTPDLLHKTAELVALVNPSIAYISIPTRPPAISTVIASCENVINEAYQIFLENKLNAELILGFEGTNTGFTGNAIEDIINICTVHPIREDTMMELLKKDNAGTEVLDSLVYNEYITKTKYKSKTFYLRKFHV